MTDDVAPRRIVLLAASAFVVLIVRQGTNGALPHFNRAAARRASGRTLARREASPNCGEAS